MAPRLPMTAEVELIGGLLFLLGLMTVGYGVGIFVRHAL